MLVRPQRYNNFICDEQRLLCEFRDIRPGQPLDFLYS